jgi:hypothetical protein
MQLALGTALIAPLQLLLVLNKLYLFKIFYRSMLSAWR